MGCKHFNNIYCLCKNDNCPVKDEICPLWEQNDYQEICKYYEAEPTYCTDKQNKLVHCESCHEECRGE